MRLTVQAGYAVQVLHTAGVVHRDIKPSNLLVDDTPEAPRVLVADLGSAKMLADASGVTMTTGTPAYMAPEQAGSSAFDARADVYALGVVGYELICGRRPFDNQTAPAGRIAERALHWGPDPIAADCGLPAAVDAVLSAALEVDPSERPSDAGSFADQLAAAARDRPEQAGRRRDWPVPVVIGLAVLLFVLSALLGWVLG